MQKLHIFKGPELINLYQGNRHILNCPNLLVVYCLLVCFPWDHWFIIHMSQYMEITQASIDI